MRKGILWASAALLAALPCYGGAALAVPDPAEGVGPEAARRARDADAADPLAPYIESIRAIYKDLIATAVAAGKDDDAQRYRKQLIRAEIHFAKSRLLERGGLHGEAVEQLDELLAFIDAGDGVVVAPASAWVRRGGPAGMGPSPGSSAESSVRLGVAIRVEGKGLLRVQGPTGEEAYVASAWLGLDASGRLVAFGKTEGAAGRPLPVLPALRIEDDALRLIVNRDGTVQVRTPAGESPYVGQIELAVFPRGDDDLVPGGTLDGLDLLFAAPDAAAVEYYTPGPGSPAGSVVYGAR